MKLLHLIVMCFVCWCYLSGFGFPEYGNSVSRGDVGEANENVSDTIIADTVWIKADTISTCVQNSGVLLKCSDEYEDKNILSYRWIDLSINKVISTSRNVWVNPANTTEYLLEIEVVESSRNLIYNGSFELGTYNGRDYGFTTAYYLREPGKWALYNAGTYVVAYDPFENHPSAFFSIKDHTSGEGKMMIINGNTGRDVQVWGQEITGLVPGQQYAFSAWATQISKGDKPILQYSINGKSLSLNNNDNCMPPLKEWVQFYKLWTAGDAGVANISLVDQCLGGGGNDFAIDDISFAPVALVRGKVVVNVQPKINLKALADLEVCEGGALEIVPQVSGSEIEGFRWIHLSDYREVGQGDKMTLSNASLESDQGEYRCVVMGRCGKDSVSFRVDVREKLRIVGNKSDTVSVCNGAPVTLSAQSATGYHLSYEWRSSANNWANPGKNWLPALANWVEYRKAVVGKADMGRYRCIVKSDNLGKCGVDTLYFVLKVKNSPVLLKKSSDTIVCANEPVSLFVKSDDPRATIRWFLQEHLLEGKETLSVIAGKEAGTYKFEVDNGCTPPATGKVMVDVFPALGQLVISDDTVVCRGGKAIFSGEAKHGMKYVWSGPGGFHAEQREVVVADVTEVKEGYYYLTVSDTCGNVQKDSVKLTIFRDLEGLTINKDTMYCLGVKVDTLQVKGGGEGLKYSWTRPNGSVVLKSKLVLGNVGYENVGTYLCKVEGKCGEMSLQTEVGLYAKLELEGNTGLTRVCEKEVVELKANSNLPVEKYEWRKDGALLTETGSVLLLGPVGEAEVGDYECTVVTVCETKRLAYRVELKKTTKITAHTLDLYVNEHSPVHLFVNAEGENKKYKWTENGVVLYSEENKLFFNDIGVANVRVFQCEVTGDCGSDRQTIKVTVGKYQTLGSDVVVRLCEGRAYMYNAGLVPTGCSGGEVLTYRWEREGKTVSNASVLEFEKLKESETGRYTCHISGACGTATLNLDVMVVKAPELMNFPDTIRLCEGMTFQHIARTIKKDLYTFSWQKNGAVLGNTDSLLHFNSIAAKDKGIYSCRVTGQCGEDEEHFDLGVMRKLNVLDAPDSLLVCREEAVRLEVVAVGEQLEYAWDGPHKSGWQGGNGAVYTNASVVRGMDEGVYRCFINSTCGRDTVAIALDIEKKLELLEESPDMVVCPNSNMTLFARVNLERVKYQWTLPDGRTSKEKELFIESIQPVDTGMYQYEVVGTCLKLNGKILLQLHQPLGEFVISEDTMVCEHASVQLCAFCEGKDVTYQWRGPGRFLSKEASFVVNDVTKASAGEYNVVAEDVCHRQKTGRVNLALLNDLKGLTISGDSILCVGESFVVKAEVEGKALGYRWTHGGQIVGEEQGLQLPMVSRADTGVYVCRVTGSCVSKEDSVRLVVYDLLKVEEGIDTVEVCGGVDTAFHVAATGEEVVYVWSRKGEEVGTRSSSLRFYSVSAVDTGMYSCRISSLCGPEVVRDFYLRMKPRTVIKNHTPDRFISENDSVMFFVRAEGENNTYKWWCDEVMLDHRGTILRILDAGKADTLNYRCVVVGDCGVDSVNMLLKIGVFKSLKETLSPDTLCEGSSYTYVADVVPETCYGDEPFVYTWYHSGVEIGNGPLLRLKDLTHEDGGAYTCVIKNECGEATVEWQIYIMELPEISYITPDTSVIEGSKHKITVSANGVHLSYSFLKDGKFHNDRQTELVFDPVSIEHQGIYRVTVGNECSSVSRESMLEVWQKTMITKPLPEEIAVCQGEDTVFRVEALGSNGLLYKWYHNGVLLSYPMVSELRLKKVALEDAGVYMCVVSGHGGNDTCSMNLVVNHLPETKISGLTEICVNELVHDYSSVSEEQGVSYEWKAVGGVLTGSSRAKEMEVTWNGKDEAKIHLEVTFVHTGCRSVEEKKIEYKQLPEVYLDIPDMVGYCLDSLNLNQGYPYGGDYRVNHFSASSVVFDHKELAYEVVYFYKDANTTCSNSEKQTITVDKEPVLVLRDERVETGLCLPVALTVTEASEGELIWSGKGILDLANVLNPVYYPKTNDGESVYFSAELTDKHGCKANDYEIVSVVPEPLVSAMRDTTVGICGEMELTVEYSTARLDRLDWFPAGLLQSSGGSSAMVKEKMEGENLYWVEVADVYGCKGVDSVVLTVLPPPPVEDKEFCENVPLTVDCHDYFGYAWNDGYSDMVRTLDKQGDYVLSVTDKFGCEGTFSYHVHPMPAVNLRDSLLFEGQTMEFVVKLDEGFGPYDIVWQDNSVSDSYLVEKEGVYSVTVSDYLGCTSTDSAYVEVRKRAIAAPDAFLPGSKGENGRFYLKEVNFASHFEMYIYDRWGKLLFKTGEIGFNGGWDGTFKGIDCLPGAYVWVALVDGKEVARGSLLLVK